MSERDNTYLSDEEREYYERTRRPLFSVPESRLGRAIFGLLVVLWFMILLLPCALFSLAFGGEIRLGHGSVPEPETHPLLLVNLVMDVDNRGLRFERSVVVPDPDDDRPQTATCVQTHVSYITWATDGSAQPAQYCDCYERTTPDAAWSLLSSETGLCRG